MRKSYKERQAECGLKVGDIVKISRKAEDYEDGWDNDWPESADTWVGKTGEIIRDSKVRGFKVFCEEEDDWWLFPYFVLEKAKEPKSYKERQAECGLKVGDKVKILRKAEDYEDGWGSNWAGAYMDDYVGRIGKIVGKRPRAGFLVFCEELDNLHMFPYFVLEKVEDEVTEKAKEPKSYEKRQAECGLKVGDKVKILREVVGFEDGWDNAWIPIMGECVGNTGVIRDMYGALGVGVETDNYGTYFFPYFVLEKVEENETPKQPEPVKPEEKKLTRYSVFTIHDQGKEFFFITATSKEETSESIIFTEESGGTWEFYKKHIIAIKTL